MIVMTAGIAALNVVASWLARRAGAKRDFKSCFTELGYQYAPVALMSPVISLGAELFEPIKWTIFGHAGVSAVNPCEVITSQNYNMIWPPFTESVELVGRFHGSNHMPRRAVGGRCRRGTTLKEL
jgi:hypothetical protein